MIYKACSLEFRAHISFHSVPAQMSFISIEAEEAGVCAKCPGQSALKETQGRFKVISEVVEKPLLESF